MRMVSKILGKFVFMALEMEHSKFDAVGERHQRKGASVTLRECSFGRRTHHVDAFEDKPCHGASDLRCEVELHAALRQCNHARNLSVARVSSAF